MKAVLTMLALLFAGAPAYSQNSAGHHKHVPAVSKGHHGGGHGAASQHMQHMEHSRLDIPDGADIKVPAVSLELTPDGHGSGAYTLFVDVKNFTFDPANVNRTSTWQEGHAHLYVNDRKITRLYGPRYFLDGFPEGKVTIMVTLNSNRHEDLFHDGKQIQATVELD